MVSGDAAIGSEVCENCRIFDFFSDPNEVLVQYGGRSLERQDLARGSRKPVLTAESGAITDAYLSDDNRWVALLLAESGDAPSAARDWITIAKESGFLACPRWSADGSLLYFLSERDGSCCIWAQRLDVRTKKPAGEPFAVWHEHQPAHQTKLLNRGLRSIGVARDKLVFLRAQQQIQHLYDSAGQISGIHSVVCRGNPISSKTHVPEITRRFGRAE